MSIYEGYLETMTAVMDRIIRLIEENSRHHEAECGEKLSLTTPEETDVCEAHKMP